MQEIYNAEDRAHAEQAIEAFARTYGVKWPKAVAKITDDADELLAFYDFPAEHRVHLRTTNPIESTFSTVKLRTKVTRGAGSPAAVGNPVIEPATVTIVAGGTQQATITDTFERSVGDVEIDKTIKGPGAGKQGKVVIRLDCDVPGGAFDRQFVIDAGTRAGTYRQPVISGIPAGTHCTLTEARTGENKKVRLAKANIKPTAITVRAGVTSHISITDKYVTRPGKGGKHHKPGGGKGGGGKHHKRDGHLPDTGTSVPTKPMTASSLSLVLAGGLTVTAARQTRRRP